MSHVAGWLSPGPKQPQGAESPRMTAEATTTVNSASCAVATAADTGNKSPADEIEAEEYLKRREGERYCGNHRGRKARSIGGDRGGELTRMTDLHEACDQEERA